MLFWYNDFFKNLHNHPEQHKDLITALKKVRPELYYFDLDTVKNFPPKVKARMNVKGNCSNCPQWVGCRYYQHIADANVLYDIDFQVTNHNMYLMNLQMASKLLLPCNYCIIDEAHKLAETSAQVFGCKIESGAVNKFLNAVRYNENPKLISRPNFKSALAEATYANNKLFDYLKIEATESEDDGEMQKLNFRLTEKVQDLIAHLCSCLQRVQAFVEDEPKYKGLHCSAIISALERFKQPEKLLYWLTLDKSNNSLYLCCAPRNIEDRMFSLLWNDGNRSTVLTSGTMRDDTGFAFFKSENGLDRLEKSKVAEGIIIIGHKADGKPIRKSVFASTQKELLPKLHQLIEDYRGVDLTEDCSMTLGEWLDTWLDKYSKLNLRTSTTRSYTVSLNHIKKHLGDKQINRVTTADIQRMYNTLKKKGRVNPDAEMGTTLADSTIRRTHMFLHEALDAAVRERLIARNPTNGTVIPKANYKDKQVFNDEQLDKFMEVIEKEPVWYDFFYTEITTGMRRGEICGLKWYDFDEKNGTMRVRRSVSAGKGGVLEIGETKTDKGKRTIVLPPSTVELLKLRKQSAMSDWIFPSLLNPEKPVAPNSAYQRLRAILRKEGLPMIRFHDLRHTFATHALKNGVDPKTLSGILGHTNASFTLDTYTHITEDMKRNASSVVGGFLTNILGEDLKPWQTDERKAQEA